MRSVYFAHAPLAPLPNGLERTLVYEEVGPRKVLFATVEYRQGDQRALISLKRASGKFPAGTIKNDDGGTFYQSTTQSALTMLDTLRALGLV